MWTINLLINVQYHFTCNWVAVSFSIYVVTGWNVESINSYIKVSSSTVELLTVMCHWSLSVLCCYYCRFYVWASEIWWFMTVVRLDESCPVKYGLRLNMDEKYRGLKKQLGDLCGLPTSQLLLVDVFGTLVRVSNEHFTFSTAIKLLTPTEYCRSHKTLVTIQWSHFCVNFVRTNPLIPSSPPQKKK
jgi:hypothetical protein